MSRNNQGEISPVAITIIAVLLSLVVVAALFFTQTGVMRSTGFLGGELFSGRPATVRELLDRGEINAAIEMLANKPDNVRGNDSSLFLLGKAWYLHAWQRHERENWASLARNPNDWFVGSDVDKALHYLQRASQSSATYADAITLVGVIYMEKGWFSRAQNAFTSVLRQDPNHREAYLNYGIALSRTGHHRAAIRHLENWNGWQTDFDFLKNLFFLYLFNERDYQRAAIAGDMFLRNAPRGNPDVTRIRRELLDLASRFPEYFNDNMIIIRDRPPEFRQRRR